MPLTKTNFAPSKAMYALAPATFSLTKFGASVGAVWLRRRAGVLTVSEGVVSGRSLNPQKPIENFEDFLQTLDGRYGGRPDFVWDGEFMTAPKTSLRDQVEASERLDVMLAEAPTVPAHMIGWYALSS